jgi:serine protease Do
MKQPSPTPRWLATCFFLLCFAGGNTLAATMSALPDFTKLVEQNSPAVVNISTSQKGTSGRFRLPPGMEMPDIPEDSPFADLFRRFFGEQGEEELPGFDAKSLGSGFIISKDGYVLTNNHVVKDADEIIVRLSDRREFVAKLVGTDKRSDVAVLKIEATDLPITRIGSGNKLKVGEWVLAIGSPFGFDHSVTAGIVSAKGRSLPSENYVPFIQTDVAINPGNSGGPLFNLDGEVVGVNSQIYSRTGGFMGVSFAIPIEVAMDVSRQLRDKGRVSRGWLGVLIQDVTRELAESFGMKKPSGALVAKVLQDSPADRAGLEVGDVIIRFDGKDVSSSSALPPLVGMTRLETDVQVEILRNGNMIEKSVTIGELPGEEDIARTEQTSEPIKENRLGVAVTELTAEQRKELELKEGGVMVTEVGDGPARVAGIREGDVLLMVNNQPVSDLAQFEELVAGLEAGKNVAVLIQRSDGPIFLALRTPDT